MYLIFGIRKTYTKLNYYDYENVLQTSFSLFHPIILCLFVLNVSL